MDYGALLRRAWDIVWENKFLILLGVLVALSGSGGSGAGSGSRGINFDGPDWDFDGPPDAPQLPDWDRDFGLPKISIALIIVLIVVAFIIGTAFWVVSTMARGGLISAVGVIDAGATSSFGQAFSAAWQKGWRLVGIGVIPAIPGLILLIGGLGVGGMMYGLIEVVDAPAGALPGAGIAAIFGALACVLVPVMLVLNLLRTFANRACMLEDVGVWDAYKRGWSVLTSNLGPALLLFAIQIGLSIVIGIGMVLPGVLMALCCILWPVLLLIQGAIAAYFSTLWTLAWRKWTVYE